MPSQTTSGRPVVLAIALIIIQTSTYYSFVFAWQSSLVNRQSIRTLNHRHPRGSIIINHNQQSSNLPNNDKGTILWPLKAAASSSGDDGKKKKKSKGRSQSKGRPKKTTTVTAKDKTKSKAKAKGKTKRSVKKKKEQEEDVKEEQGAVKITAAETTTTSSTSPQDLIVIKTDDSNINTNNTYNGIWYGPVAKAPDILDFDLTGGRPGAIIESEEQLERKAKMFAEMKDGTRIYPKWMQDYGFQEQEEDVEYDTDDPDAIDAETLGRYDITDLRTKFDYEWDPSSDPDPNLLENYKNDFDTNPWFLPETPKDEEGIEIGYDPMFGPSNPIDERTKIGIAESYMVDERTKDDDMLQPQFHPNDPEIAFNEEFVQWRRSLDIIETYQDEYLPEDLPVPRHAAKWYGYPEMLRYPRQNYTNNRYTKLEDLTNFDELTPFRARQKAVELARANNAEWLPDGVSQAWHQEERRPYEEIGTLVGTLRRGECDPELVERIQPALKALGSCVDLLSIENEGKVFRFHYHGLMKNKFGMSCWTETLIRDCGVEVTGVVFETGFRKRDPLYDGGFPYHGWE